MKRLIGVICAGLAALALAGCDVLGTNGNDTGLTGTWTYKSATVGHLSTTPAASDKEGVWEFHDISYPNTPSVYKDASGVVITRYHVDDTTTTTIDVTMTIQADGSFVRKAVILRNTTARAAAPADTATAIYTGATGAIVASSTKFEITETVVVTLDGAGYKQVKTNDYKVTNVLGGTTTVQSASNAATDYLSSPSGLAYNTTSGISLSLPSTLAIGLGLSSSGAYVIATVSLTQTAYGTTPAASGIDYTVTSTKTLVIADDGSYTLTTTEVQDFPEIAAVPATATTAGFPHILAGTRTCTIVEKGFLSSQKVVTGLGTTPVGTMYLNPNSKTEAHVGTGGWISASDNPTTTDFNGAFDYYWPASAATKNVSYKSYSWNYTVIGGTGENAKTNMITGSDVYWTKG